MNQAVVSNVWYREPWVWGLMAGPGIVVVAAFVSLWLAISTWDGLVVDDYYKEGKAINRTIARDTMARGMGLSGTIALNPVRGVVELDLTGANIATLPQQLRLLVVHPTQAGHDLTVLLEHRGNGRYVGQLGAMPAATRWDLTLEDIPRTWRLMAGWKPGTAGGVELQPAAHQPTGEAADS